MTTDLNAEANIGVARFQPSALARGAVLVAAATLGLLRLVFAVGAARESLDDLTAYGFTVIFPLALVLLIFGRSRTREGVLMRLATIGQLLLIVAIPPYALQLLLGLPIAFLFVELFETRLPAAIRDPIATRLVRC
jgi:hypothetical protein